MYLIQESLKHTAHISAFLHSQLFMKSIAIKTVKLLGGKNKILKYKQQQ